jgi:site-specific recombinase XerD
MKLTKALETFYQSMSGVLSPGTILFYKNRMSRLVVYLEDPELDTIKLANLRTWRAWLTQLDTKWGRGSEHPECKGSLSPYTLNQYVRCAKRFFLWCVDEGLIDNDPGRRFEKPPLPKRVPRGISGDDRDKMLDSAGDARSRMIVLFLSDTACRVAGLATLQLQDVDLVNRRAVLREKGRGGWGKERAVFFTETTAEAIRDYLKVRPNIPTITTLMVGSKHGRGGSGYSNYGTDGIRMTLKNLANKAGVKSKSNPHSFRHAAIRAWLNNGMPISEVAILAGHSTVQVTADFYGVVPESTLKADHGRYTWVK